MKLIFVAVQLAAVVLFIVGFYEIVYNAGKNWCKMTYMFEYPQYIAVQPQLPEVIREKHPHRCLVVYGEGVWVNDLAKGKFSGIPVLFIPGSGGTEKQARSLGSVLHQKTQVDKILPYHFDVFAVGFNDENSAIYGPALFQQAEFVAASIDHILSLYGSSSSEENDRGKPESVVIVAHSMGGLIPRFLMRQKSFDTKKISAVITLASPHASPVAMLDAHIKHFYESLSNGHDLVTEISVVGGLRDWVVPARITAYDGGVTTISHAVPDVWASTDHLCSVWCKQLVLVTSRAVLDWVDLGTMQISKDDGLRKQIARYHFSHRSAGKKYYTSKHPEQIKSFDTTAKWLEVSTKQWSMSSDRLNVSTYFMVPIYERDENFQQATVFAEGSELRDWVYLCRKIEIDRANPRVKKCLEAMNYSAAGRILPPVMGRKRKVVHVPMHNLRKELNVTHLVLYLPAKNFVTYYVDVYGIEERKILGRLSPNPGDLPLLGDSETNRKTMAYNVTLPGLNSYWKSYELRITPIEGCDSDFAGHMIFHVPWSSEDKFETVHGKRSSTIDLFYQTPSNRNSATFPFVELILHPQCQYRLATRFSLFGSIAQITRLSWSYLPAFFVFALLLGVSQQLHFLAEVGRCVSLLSTSEICLRGVLIVYASFTIAHYFHDDQTTGFVPDTDVPYVVSATDGFLMLPLLLYLAAAGLLFISIRGLWVGTLVYGNSLQVVAVRIFKRAVVPKLPAGDVADIVTDLAVDTLLSRFPFILAFALTALAFATCGSVALVVGAVGYFIKIGKFYEDFLQDLLIRGLRGKKTEISDSKLLSQVRFHISMLLLWLTIIGLNIGSLVFWFHQAKELHDLRLSPDPSLYVSIVFCMSISILWQEGVPFTGAGRPSEFFSVPSILLLLAIFGLLNGLVHIYVLSNVVGLAFMLITAQQARALASKN